MAKSKAAKAGSAALAVKSSPYVQRLVSDEELRDNLKTAFDSARVAFDRLSNGKAPGKVLLDDKKFHKELQTASEALQSATQALREGPVKKKKKRGRKLLLVVVGAGLALGLSEGLRNKVLDLLFGAEEEFDYTSTTAPASPPPTPAAAAS
ncbi:MAG TPA: hypothetical protein VIL49_14405 [Capillimicrobium sp.]|jgi:hypothetical protein